MTWPLYVAYLVLAIVGFVALAAGTQEVSYPKRGTVLVVSGSMMVTVAAMLCFLTWWLT